MATYGTNRDSGGLTNEKGHLKFWSRTFSGNVLNGQQVVQNSPTNMNVRVSEGNIRIPYDDYAYMGWSEGYTLVPISTADPSNPRIDRIVAYFDRSMTFTDLDINNPGILKYKSVSGTPNAVPSKVSDASVDSSVSNNPWVELATVRVNAAATQILDANITDTRSFVNLSSDIAANHLAPVGTINDFAGTTAPSGWLLCYGQAISRNTYSTLFSVLGTLYGSGDGSTTFNLPDCRGRASAGKDNMGGTSLNLLTGLSGGVDGDVLGAKGGAESHIQTIAEIASHTHNVGAISTDGNVVHGGGSGSNANLAGGGGLWRYSNNPNSGSTGSSTPFNIVQPTIIFNKIIKT